MVFLLPLPGRHEPHLAQCPTPERHLEGWTHKLLHLSFPVPAGVGPPAECEIHINRARRGRKGREGYKFPAVTFQRLFLNPESGLP